MISFMDLHLVYNVYNSKMNTFPFPHFYIQNIFEDEYYSKIIENLPEEASEIKPKIKFNEEFYSLLDETKRKFWIDFRERILCGNLKSCLLDYFKEHIHDRFKNNPNVKFYDDVFIARTEPNTTLTAHTDTPDKVISLIFYLPTDFNHKEFGTAVYLKDDEMYHRIYTAPYFPNSVFGFVRTEESYHGIEPIYENYYRWAIRYSIYQH